VAVPHLLVVDDSEAILAYEIGALSSDYTLTTARNGREALDKLSEIRPAAVLLDLSMPEMTGDELLARMGADPALATIPVIVVSSERTRGEASLKRGARAFLPKPIRALELREIVGLVLEDERRRSREGELAVLFLRIGRLEVGIPLDAIREILLQPMTRSVDDAPEYLSQSIDYRGVHVPVLDLALALSVEHAEPLAERKLVVLDIGDRCLAISVDSAREPEVFPLRSVESVALVTEVKTLTGVIPVIDPRALLSPEPLRRLADALRERQAPAEEGGDP
jgi:CheY-like chemotaxis protein